jgi:hypothetical protein
VSEPEDEDVDSGWGDDDDEAAPMTRAVDSARLLAEAGLAALPSAADRSDEAPITPRAESLPPIEAAPISEQPATRRASDDELARVRDRSKPPVGAPLRLSGRKHTPLVSDAASRARSLDASAEAARRPTPSTVPPVGSALRFPTDGTRALREAHRRPTVINKAVRELDPLAQTVEAPATLPAELIKGSGTRKESAPLVDLEIPDAFDLSLDGDAEPKKAPAASLSFDDLDDVGATSKRGPTKVTAPAIPKAVKAAVEATKPAAAEPVAAPAKPAGAPPADAERGKVTARAIDRKALAAELAARRQAERPSVTPPAPAAKLAPAPASKSVAPKAGLVSPRASAPPPSPKLPTAAVAPAPANKLAVPRLGGAKSLVPAADAPRPGASAAPASAGLELSDDFDLGPVAPVNRTSSLPVSARAHAAEPVTSPPPPPQVDVGSEIDLDAPPSGGSSAAVTPAPPPVSEEPDMAASARVALESLDSLEMFEQPVPADAGADEGSIELDDDASLSDEEREALALSERDPDGESVTIDVEEAPEDPELEPIRVRFEKGDYMGALLRAEAALEGRPDFEAAKRYAESARELLKQLYLEKLGSGGQVLRLAMAPDEIQGLTLDHRSGFLISFIDGTSTVDEILDMSGMPQLETLRLLFEMRQQGVVAVDSMATP